MKDVTCVLECRKAAESASSLLRSRIFPKRLIGGWCVSWNRDEGDVLLILLIITFLLILLIPFNPHRHHHHHHSRDRDFENPGIPEYQLESQRGSYDMFRDSSIARHIFQILDDSCQCCLSFFDIFFSNSKNKIIVSYKLDKVDILPELQETRTTYSQSKWSIVEL